MENFKLKWKSRNHGLFWHDLYVYGVYKNEYIKKHIGFQENNIKATYFNGIYSFYLCDNEIEKHIPEIRKLYLTDQFRLFANKIYTILNWPIYFKYRYQSKNEIKSRLKILAKKYQEAVALYACTESYYVDLLVKDIEEKASLVNIKPKFIPSVVLEQLEWYKLCLNSNDSLEQIKIHLKKWKYIICSHQTDPYTLKKLKERFVCDTKNLEVLKKNYHELLYNTSTVSNIYVNKLQTVFSEISYLRTELRLVWMQLGYLIKNIILKYYWKDKKVFNYTLEEILNHRFSKEYRDEFVYLLNNGNEQLYYNNLMKYPEENDSFKKEIYGTMCFGKKVKGSALIVTSKFKYSDVTENTILVVPQLTYELVPILGKVIGVVTDEGGITSHVNILAREMNKSMVIGTNYSTQYIKTGYMIELDCNQSKVTILDVK